MKKIVIYPLFVFLLSCGSVSKTKKALTEGDYKEVIHRALKQIPKSNAKQKALYIDLLNNAYAKAVDKDLRTIRFYKQENNPSNLRAVYNLYLDLEERQEKVRVLMPLKGAKIKFKDYTKEIINAKQMLSAYLISNAQYLINLNTTQTYREAYYDLKYLNQINPGFQNTAELLNICLTGGRSYVLLDVENKTDKILPKKWVNDILKISTYNLNSLWNEYHNTRISNFNYDYQVNLTFKSINISPESISERKLVQEKLIEDGFEYSLDENGNVKKDSLGNDIKTKKFKKIYCTYFEFKQFKSAQVGADIEVINVNTQQLEDSFPISTDVFFEHIHATYQGDISALSSDLLPFLEFERIPFPSDEQMILDSGQEIKQQFKSILNNWEF